MEVILVLLQVWLGIRDCVWDLRSLDVGPLAVLRIVSLMVVLILDLVKSIHLSWVVVWVGKLVVIQRFERVVVVLNCVHRVTVLVVCPGACWSSWEGSILMMHLVLHRHVSAIAQGVYMSFLPLEHYTLHHWRFVVLQVR